MNHTTNPQDAVVERVARHLAARDWSTTDDRWDGATASFRADYLAAAREVLAHVPSAVVSADRATLLREADEEQVDRLAAWLWNNCAEDERTGLLADDPRKIAAVALRWPELRRVAAEEQPAETQDSFQVWPLRRVLAEVRCGSQDWTWDEEWADLDRRHAETGYLAKLEQAIRENGITMPVLIGSDGRLWDGHHRLRIAARLGIDYVPVEITPQPARPAVGEQPDTQTREARCTCARSWNLHSRDCAKYRPGHELAADEPAP